MNPEELKKEWQEQAAACRITIDSTHLLNEVRRNQRHFESALLWRDVREVGVSLLTVSGMIYVGIYMDRKLAPIGGFPWTWNLCAAAMLWLAGFLVVERVRRRRRQPKPADTLRESIENGLFQVEREIWLARNVFWWTLPVPAACLMFLSQCALQFKALGCQGGFAMGSVAAIVALVYWGVCRLCQHTAQKELEPRRQELESLLQSLKSSGM
jgi:hypothetical protein